MRIKDLPSTNSVSPADFIVVDQNPTNPVTRRATLASALGQNAQAEVLTSVSGVDTITATSAQAFTDYAAGQRFQFGTAGANTGAVTLAVNGLAAKAVVAVDGTALTAGALPAGTWVTVEYNGTAFTVLGYHVLRSSWGAGAVGNTPAGGIAATTVQGALNELDTEKISFTRLDDSDGSSLVGFLQAGTGAVTRTAQSKMRDVVSVLDFGAVGDGVADDTVAFGLADTAVSGGQLYVPAGTYRFASNTSLSAVLVMAPGAVLKPATSIKVNLSKAPVAGLHQIFDRSGGGAVQFIGGGIPEVFAEWWGARGGTGGRTDNNVPIQHALDAVQSVIYSDFATPAPNADNNGGVVVLGYSTDYLMSGRIHLRNRARIRGQGRFSELKINNATWGADTELVYSVNGTSSQFWCRLEDLALNCNENTVINRVVYAPAWQESCGLRDVLIEKFRCNGVYIDNGYGGSVGATFKQIQFFPSSSIAFGRSAIYVDVPYSSGVFNLLLEEVSFAGWLTSGLPGVDLTGVFAKGRVRIQCRGVHTESFDYGVTLDTDASLYGLLGAGGNATVNSVVGCNSSWTGEIDCPAINKGGATYLVRSFAAGTTNIYRDVEPVFKRVVYPHTPSEILAYCRNTAAGGTLDSTAFGFSSITRTGAGQYTINFDAAKFAPNGGTAYRVKVEIGSTAGRTYYVAGQTATKIDLVFKDLANAVADCDFFDVFIYGRPGL